MHCVRFWALPLLALTALGCSADPGAVDDAYGGEDLGEATEPVSCGAGLLHYPVAGPHNGGYDKNALSYTCAPHPGSSPDNSDFLGGDHYGNDIFAAKGTPVVSPVNGTVIKAGWNTVGGLRVTVQDGCGWSYYHAHLDSIVGGIAVGTPVKAGQHIGNVGNTGNASGTSPHLHFSVYPGVYESGIDPFPLLQAVDSTACGQQCKPHCEGSKIISGDCGAGDCAAYGATCVDDALGVRCSSVFCPTVGKKKVCLDKETIGDCNDGAISTGKCSAYGSLCIDDAKGARCVVVFCADQPAKAHDACLPDGTLVHCSDIGVMSEPEACPAKTSCVNGACVDPNASGGAGGAGGAAGALDLGVGPARNQAVRAAAARDLGARPASTPSPK